MCSRILLLNIMNVYLFFKSMYIDGTAYWIISSIACCQLLKLNFIPNLFFSMHLESNTQEHSKVRTLFYARTWMENAASISSKDIFARINCHTTETIILDCERSAANLGSKLNQSVLKICFYFCNHSVTLVWLLRVMRQ